MPQEHISVVIYLIYVQYLILNEDKRTMFIVLSDDKLHVLCATDDFVNVSE